MLALECLDCSDQHRVVAPALVADQAQPGVAEQALAQQRHAGVEHLRAQRRPGWDRRPLRQRLSAQARIGGAQGKVLRHIRARPGEGIGQVVQPAAGEFQRGLAIVLDRPVGAAPQRFDLLARQAAVGQVVQGAEVGVAGQQIAADPVLRRGAGAMGQLADAFEVVAGRGQAVVGQLFELPQQAIDLPVGAPHRRKILPRVESLQTLAGGRLQRREITTAVRRQLFEGRAQRADRLASRRGEGRQRQQQQSGSQTKCVFFVQRCAPRAPFDC